MRKDRVQLSVSPEVYRLLKVHKNMSQYVSDLVLRAALDEPKEKKSQYRMDI